MKLLVDASASQSADLFVSNFSLFLFLVTWLSYLLPLLLGPRCHSCLQSVQLSHDEAGVFPQRIGALVHLLSDP